MNPDSLTPNAKALSTAVLSKWIFLKSKESVKNENVFGNPIYKTDKIGAFKNYLNGIVGQIFFI